MFSPIPKTRLWSVIALVVTVLVVFSGIRQSPVEEVVAQEAGTWQPQNLSAGTPTVIPAQHFDTSPELRTIPPSVSANALKSREIPLWPLPRKTIDKTNAPQRSRVMEPAMPAVPAIPAPNLTFEGVGNVNNVLPPDPVGDIGPNHYVEMVNIAFAIYDRSGNLLYGPANNNTLFAGFGGPCETANDGDPIVLYDHLADRWMMSQFALPNFPSGPFYQCIAVSQSGDPLGAWHRYEFLISNTKLNDYPKFGVWPDGYYMTINQFTCSIFTCSWAGAGAVAFERDQMLNGLPANMVYFDLFGIDPNLGGMLPSDLDGPAPPAGTPNVVMQMDDDAWGYSPDQVQLWDFHVDWGNPAASTFTFNTALPVAAFDSDLCGYARDCIPQPGTAARVDAISDRLMFRLQFRDFGTHQTLVTNHTVDVDGSDHAGIRWYEVRNSGSGWFVHQQGTYAPDANHRWMGSAAMDGQGNMAIGFSVSSSTLFPSIHYTGRLAGDPLGTMPQGEGIIITGSGSQTSSFSRWGDYSALSVDPTDDCTFWYVTEYYPTTSQQSWHTRVGTFDLGTCGTPTPTPTATATPPGPTPTPTPPPTTTPTPTPTPTPQAFFFLANMNGDNEVPPVTTNTMGRARFRLSPDETRLQYRVLVRNLVDGTAAHIHCGAPGVNGPVGATLFSGGPVSIASGVLTQGLLTAPDAGNGCGWLTLADMVADMRAGNTYINVHTLAHPSGEIRGPIMPLLP
nr:CHRD domain-containing protein [Ardenticatena sp.]